MNRILAEKILATVFVIALFGGVYFLIQTFTQNKPTSLTSDAQQTNTNGTENQIIPAVADKAAAVRPYYYLEDFYTETANGLVLRTHSDSNFRQVLTTAVVEKNTISGPMLQFTELKNGQRQQQYFNLEALVNQLNNAQ